MSTVTERDRHTFLISLEGGGYGQLITTIRHQWVAAHKHGTVAIGLETNSSTRKHYCTRRQKQNQLTASGTIAAADS